MVSTQSHKSAQILLKHGPGQLRILTQVLERFRTWAGQTERQVYNWTYDPENFTQVVIVMYGLIAPDISPTLHVAHYALCN